jgi:hypothetical protein
VLVRALYHIAVQHNFDVKLVHVPGVENVEADLLSRGLLARFKSLYGNCYHKLPPATSRDFVSQMFTGNLMDRSGSE